MIKTKETHPSYGMMQFSRVSGSSTALFGSSIRHRDTIRMRVMNAEVDRHLSNDWYFGKKEIIEVEMSYSQFAEAITSMNQGSGVPVTIRHIQGEQIEPCPFIDKRMQFEKEFEENLKGANETACELIHSVREMFTSKKTLNKKDKEEVLGKLNQILRAIDGSASFIYSQFNEQMDKTTREAKGEIEAFMQNKINSIANAALVEHRDEILQLENPVGLGENE